MDEGKGFIQKWLSDIKLFQSFVSSGFKIMQDINDTDRAELLKEIFKKNNLQFVKELLKSGLDVTDSTLLSLAIESTPRDGTSIVSYLVKQGCPVNVVPPEAHCRPRDYVKPPSPLLTAIENKQQNIIGFLIKNGANVEKPELLALGKSLDVSLVDVFKKSGFDLNAVGNIIFDGVLEIPRDNREWGKYTTDIKPAKQIAMIRALLRAGISPCNPTHSYTCGHTFIRNSRHFSKKEKVAMMNLLLKNGQDVNAVNVNNATMLHITPWEDTEMLEFLLDRGADPNLRNRKGCTPALVKINQVLKNRGNPEQLAAMIQLFIRYKADMNCLNTKDDKGEDILTYLLPDRNPRHRYWLFPPKNDSAEERASEKLIFQNLLSVAEIDLPTKRQVDGALERKYRLCIFPLLQAGCSFYFLLHYVSIQLASSQISCPDFDGLAACTAPTFPLRIKPGGKKNKIRRFVSHQTPKLESLAVHAIRKQILTANGNKSLIPRARKLPLPQSLIKIVTLECYTIKEIGNTGTNVYHDDLFDLYDDREPEVDTHEDEDEEDDYDDDDDYDINDYNIYSDSDDSDEEGFSPQLSPATVAKMMMLFGWRS